VLQRRDSAPQIAVISMGGTIAMTAGLGSGAVPTLSAEQLLASVPGLGETGIEVTADDLARVPGASLDFSDIATLQQTISRHLAAGAQGVVVTQGTDTIEETAYLLDLCHDGQETVVFTGAMRHSGLAGADGPANLLAAVQVAAAPWCRGLGVLVVLADQIHAASRVAKAHTTSGSAFTSPNGGPLGYVAEGRPVLLSRPVDRTVLTPVGARREADVGLLTMTLGDTGSMLTAVAGHLDGLVVAGFGAGHVSSWLVDPLEELAGRIPVVLASRTGAGPVLTRTYDFPGSERDLLSRGLTSAGLLNPLKARILLHELLASGHDHAAIRETFAAAGGLG
jgi:L-asparaginase